MKTNLGKNFTSRHFKSNKTSTKFLQAQKGRSMVEMLGVLAIIGVLSVMGISAYTTAMKKHQANTLFDEMLKRAIVVAGQLNFGSTHPTLSDFPTETEYGTFASNAVPNANGTQFSLSIEGVNKGVCEQVQALAETSKITHLEPTNCSDNAVLQFTFNNDLSILGPENSANPDTPIDCSKDEESCSGCQTCQNGTCQDDSSECDVGEVCSDGKCGCLYGREACGTIGCCDAGTICGKKSSTDSSFACIALGEPDNPPPDDLRCVVNADCNALANSNEQNYYCLIPYSNQGGCYNPKIGTCTVTTEDDLHPVSYNGRTFYVGPSMNWWAAENFCLSHGKRLVSFSSFALSQDYINSNGSGPLYQAFISIPNLKVDDKNNGNYYWTSTSTGSPCPVVAINIKASEERVLNSENRFNKRDRALCE